MFCLPVRFALQPRGLDCIRVVPARVRKGAGSMRNRADKEHVRELTSRRTKVQVATLVFIVVVCLWWEFVPRYTSDDWMFVLLLGVPLVLYIHLVWRCPACDAALSRYVESCSKCGILLREKKPRRSVKPR